MCDARGAVVVVEAWRLELTRMAPQNSAWLLYLKGALYPPHAIVMRLHGRDSYVVILIPETANLLGL